MLHLTSTNPTDMRHLKDSMIMIHRTTQRIARPLTKIIVLDTFQN